MKRFYKFLMPVLLMIALAVPLGSRAQVTLTVADGTTTNNYVPVYGFYADAYLRAEFVYPSTLLTSMTGSLINSVTFYASTSSVSWGSANFVVSVKEIASSTLTGFYSGNDMTQVYTGSLSIGSNGQMTVTFATPYLYGGGNLLFKIDNMVEGTYVTSTWYGISSTGSSYQGYDYDDYSDITATSRDFLPKATFNYIPSSGDYCPAPMSPTVLAVTSTSATIGWSTLSMFADVVSNYNVEYGEQGFVPGNGTVFTTTDDSIDLTGLTDGTVYDVYLYTTCTSSGSDTVFLSFRTPVNPVDVFPYITGFEADDDSLWAFVNGTATNKWFIGSATNNGGTRSLYVSNDNGVSNAYTVTSTSNVYAYRAFNFTETGDYAFSFDWKAGGESSYDYIYAYIAPGTTDFSGSTISTGDWTNVSGRLNQQTSWQTSNNVLSIETPGTYYLVFYWKNDDSQGTMPPAAIDNINVYQITCPAVRNLMVDTNTAVTSTSVTLDWTPVGTESAWAVRANGGEWEDVYAHPYTVSNLTPATSYTFEVVAICDDTSFVSTVSARTACADVTALPWSEGFEGMPTGTGNRPVCWTTVMADGNYPYISTTRHSGASSLYMYCRDTTNNMVASPLFSGISANQLHVKFWAQASNYGTLYVGLMTDTAVLSTFEVVDSVVNGGATWREYEFYTDNVTTNSDFHVVFRWRVPGTSRYNCYVDDIVVEQSSSCRRPMAAHVDSVSYYSATLSWNDPLVQNDYVVRYATVNDVESEEAIDVAAMDTTVTLTGLSPYTLYYAWVATNCGSEHTDWRTVGSFRTLRTCYPVTNLTVVETTATAANFSWKYNSQVGIEPNGVYITVSDSTGVIREFEDYTDTTLLLTQLQPGTDYVLSIRTLCSPDTATAVVSNFSTMGCGELVGTATSSYSPFQANYNYGYTQTIYPASVVANMDSISGIAYRVASSNSMLRTFSVYIGYTNQTTISTTTYLPISSLTQVASVTGFDPSTMGWKTINFTQTLPVDHTQNIVVAVVNTTGTYSSYNWGAHTLAQQGGIGGTVYWYRDDSAIDLNNPTSGSPTSGTSTTAIPDIRFIGECDMSCSAPLLSLDAIDENTATLSWTQDGDSWTLQYRAASELVWQEEETSSTSAVISGLNPATLYEFRVMAICSTGDTAYSSVRTAYTSCAPVTNLPYEENFESMTSTSSTADLFHPCWLKGGSRTSEMPYISTYNGSKVLHFYAYGSYYGYTVLPEFDENIALNTLELTFDGRKASTTASYGGQIIVAMVDSTNLSLTTPIDTVAVVTMSNTTMEPKYVDLTTYTGNRRRIAFINVCPAGCSYNYAELDNLSLHTAPSCLHPNSVEVTATTGSSITVHVSGEAGSTYRCYYSTASTIDSVDVTDSVFTLTGLNQMTTYNINVTRVCFDGSLTGTVRTTGTTTMIGASVPYVTGFEPDDDVAWQFVNGTQTNKWCIGTAAHNGENSTRALYISNDNGTSNTYSNGSSSYVFAYKTIDFGPGQYMISYDWKAQGESSSYDYMRVFVVPGTTTFTAGSSNSISYTGAPTGWIAVDGGSRLNLQNTWQHIDQTVTFTDSSTMIMVFYWYNDNSGGSNPPAAVDNVSITLLSCPAPANLTASNVTADQIDVTWQSLGEESEWSICIDNGAWTDVTTTSYSFTGLAANTNHTIQVRANCDAEDTSIVTTLQVRTACTETTLPYVYGFDDLATYEFPSCWHRISGYSTTSYTYPYATSTNHSGGRSLYVYSGSSSVSTLITTPFIPEPLNNLEINFWARRGGSYTMEVGVMTDLADASSFTSIYTLNSTTLPATSTWYEVNLTTPDTLDANMMDSGYVAFRMTGSNTFYIDDIEIMRYNPCRYPVNFQLDSVSPYTASLSWSDPTAAGNYRIYWADTNDFASADSVDVYSTDVTLMGLQPHTTYYLWARTLCGNGFSEYTTVGSFTTEYSCYPIVNLQRTSVTETAAAFSWTLDERGLEANSVMVTLVDLSDTNAAPVVTSATGNTYHLFSSLTPAHQYRVYFNTICNPDTAEAVVATFATATPVCHVVEGDTVVSYAPFYGFYNYGYTQTLYPASEMGTIDTITGIGFRVATVPSNYTNRPVRVYLGNASMTSVSEGSMVTPANLTLVANNASFDISSTGWTSIAFDSAFVYTPGSNLVVAIENLTGNYSNFAWGAHTSTGSWVTYYTDDYAVDYAAAMTDADLDVQESNGKVPDIRFHGLCPAPSCLAPLVVVSGYDTTSVTLNWMAGGNETAWTVEYRPYGTATWSTAVASTSATTYTVTGLNPSSRYYFRVGSLCSDDTIYADELESYTACGAVHIPVTYGSSTFALTNADLPCWDFTSINRSSTSGVYYRYFSSSASLMVLPEIAAPLNTAQVRITATTGTSAGSSFRIGIMDGSAITWVDTIHVAYTGSSYNYTGAEYVSYLNNYTGTGNRVVIGSTTTNTIYIWEITVEPLETCFVVDDIEVVSVSDNSATLTIDHVSASNFLVQYRANSTSTWNSMLVSGTTFTISGLSAMTDYQVRARAICSAGDTSRFGNAMASFSTAMCAAGTQAQNYTSAMSSTTSSYSPLGTSMYNYGFVQTIIDSAYLASLGGDITAMAFHPASTEKGNYYNGMNVYLANVSENDLSSRFILPDATHQFTHVIVNRSFNYTDTTWQIQTFDTSFAWDGHSNILVTVNRAHGSWSSGASFRAHTTNGTVRKMREAHNDSNPYSLTSLSATSGSANAAVGDLRLYSCGESTFCAAPAALTVTDTTEASATISWTGTASSYEVACVLGTWVEPTTPVTVSGNTHPFTGLLPDTVYTIGVRAVCSEESVSQWVFTTVRTLEHSCMIPTNVQVSNVTLNSAVIDWTPGENETEWELNITGTNYDRTVAVTSENKPYTVTGLANNQTYFVKVRAICGQNNYSEWSDEKTFTTTTCQPVSNLGKSNITAHSATISWNAPSADVVNFEIEYGLRGFNQGSGTLVTVNGAMSYNLTGLLEETAYDVYVRSICAEGANSTWSAISVTTLAEQQGIEDVDNASISLYPNPASSTVTLTGIAGMATVTVVDMNGRVSGEWTVNDGTLTIDVTSMAQGAYFVRIVGEQTNAIRKLIVR